MHSNHRHNIRFKDIVCLKLNKWSVKILKNSNKKNFAKMISLLTLEDKNEMANIWENNEN